MNIFEWVKIVIALIMGFIAELPRRICPIFGRRLGDIAKEERMGKTSKPLGQWWEDMEHEEGLHCYTKLEDGSYLNGRVFIGDMPIGEGVGGGVIIGDIPSENITPTETTGE